MARMAGRNTPSDGSCSLPCCKLLLLLAECAAVAAGDESLSTVWLEAVVQAAGMQAGQALVSAERLHATPAANGCCC
jgi:hypothetical protein